MLFGGLQHCAVTLLVLESFNPFPELQVNSIVLLNSPYDFIQLVWLDFKKLAPLSS